MRPEHKNRSIADVEFFSSLTDAGSRKIDRVLAWHSFAEGETILNEAKTSDDVYFIVEGGVQILGFAESGQAAFFASLESGNYFGELSAIDKRPRSATVVANAPSVVAVLPGDEFRRLILSKPKIAYAVLKKLADVVRASNLQIIDLSGLDLQQRICLELLRLAEPARADSRDWRIHPLPTQQEMAVAIGSTRESVSRVMNQLSHSGIIRRNTQTLHVLDRRKLEDMVLSGERSSDGHRFGGERRKAALFLDNYQRSGNERREGYRRNVN